MRASDLLHPRPEGLYCPPGDFFIDPVRPVNRALITHGHSDHARSGHRSVLATQQTLDIMGLRYGEHFADTTQAARLGETIVLDGVSVTLTGIYAAAVYHYATSGRPPAGFEGGLIEGSFSRKGA